MEEADFNVRKKEITETTYLNVTDITLKFKQQKSPGTYDITADILQKVGPTSWRGYTVLIKIIWN